MLLLNSLDCLVHGHALSPITHGGSDYQYCLKCGKIESTGRSGLEVVRSVSPLPDWGVRRVALSTQPQGRQY